MMRRAASALDFTLVLERVAARAATPMGREAILSLAPTTDAGVARAELHRVVETLRFSRSRPGWVPPPPPDFRGGLRKLGAEGAVLSADELLVALRLLTSMRALSDALAGGAPPPEGEELFPTPALDALRSRLPVLREIEALLAATVDEEGRVRDGASPALGGLRRSLRSARGRVVRALESLLASLPDRIRVEDASVSIREGRYVIPIRREGKSEVGGILHGESGTGATLFVEPPAAVQLMNEVHELEREEVREVERILREVSARLHPHREALESGFEAMVDFDSLWARARTAEVWNATLPTLTAVNQGEVRIVQGRHPLLIEKGIRVIPFSIELSPEERVVVLSGPNTGGKTVLLKAFGLLHLLAQSGILPPVADGTSLPVVREVFVDIGDGQSIAESLSTFSAHLANASEILRETGAGDLVLMDELGTGTDPAEGAALARALLEALVERGTRALVTSHLGMLKRLDRTGSGIVNASLLFDPDRIEPTYQLLKGRPGRSYALAIARRLGFSHEVLDRAEGYVDAGELRIENLLESLERKERELSEATESAAAALEEANRLRGEAEERESRIAELERTAERRAREDARRLLLEARGEVEEAIRELRSASESAEDPEAAAALATRARARVERAAREQGKLLESRERKSAGAARSEGEGHSLHEGDSVRLVASGASGTVREVREDRILVEVGGMRLRLAPDAVERISAREVRELSRAREASTPLLRGWTGPEVDVKLEADLRGLRVDEVELGVGRALDGAVLGNLAELRIIHGKGTGAVKARVQELLRRDSRVKEFRPGGDGEGGSGVTVAVLK